MQSTIQWGRGKATTLYQEYMYMYVYVHMHAVSNKKPFTHAWYTMYILLLDIAVSAPYEASGDGSGAVYIYYGQSNWTAFEEQTPSKVY